MHLDVVDQINLSIVILTKCLFSSILSKRSDVRLKFDKTFKFKNAILDFAFS